MEPASVAAMAQKAAISPFRAMPMLRQTADGPEPVSAADPKVMMAEEMRRTSSFRTMPK